MAIRPIDAGSPSAVSRTVIEYETLERGIRVLTSAPAEDVARQFELEVVRSWERSDQRRVDGRVSRPDAKALATASPRKRPWLKHGITTVTSACRGTI